jgi:hypothetical protein
MSSSLSAASTVASSPTSAPSSRVPAASSPLAWTPRRRQPSPAQSAPESRDLARRLSLTRLSPTPHFRNSGHLSIAWHCPDLRKCGRRVCPSGVGASPPHKRAYRDFHSSGHKPNPGRAERASLSHVRHRIEDHASGRYRLVRRPLFTSQRPRVSSHRSPLRSNHSHLPRLVGNSRRS